MEQGEMCSGVDNNTIDPRIAIVVPVFNVERYLRRCIDSILAQTYPNFELILVDDGSSDTSGVICDEYDDKEKRVTVFHKENGGQSSARNCALKYICGELEVDYLTFIDSDDWVAVDYLETLINLLAKTNADISCCDFVRIRSSEEVNVSKENENCFIACGDPETIWIDYLGTTGYFVGKLFPRSFFLDFLFAENRIFEDVGSLHLILFKAKRIAYSPTVKYYYYYNQDSTTGKNWSPKKLDALWAHEQQLAFLKKHNHLRAYDVVMRQYVSTVAQAIEKLSSFPDFKRIRRKLRFKLKHTVLFRNKYLDNNRYSKDYYTKNAFPSFFYIKKRLTKHFH